jgi:hypothetical protein
MVHTTNPRRSVWVAAAAGGFGILISVSCGTAPSANVLTERNNNSRTGAAVVPGLNKNTVRNFGLVGTLPVNSPVLAQPLIVEGLRFRGARHSVVWIATATNKIYAFSAEPPFEPLGVPNRVRYARFLLMPLSASAPFVASSLPFDRLRSIPRAHDTPEFRPELEFSLSRFAWAGYVLSWESSQAPPASRQGSSQFRLKSGSLFGRHSHQRSNDTPDR